MNKFTDNDLKRFTQYINNNSKQVAKETEQIIASDLHLKKQPKSINQKYFIK